MKKYSVLSMLFILAMSLTGQNINTCAGTGLTSFNGDNIQATTANIMAPTAMIIDPSGNIIISTDNRIRKISPAGVITTIAGNGIAGSIGDGGQATLAQINNPTGLAIDASGNIYVVDRNNLRVRKITPAGIISTFAGGGSGGDGVAANTASLSSPVDVAVDAAGNVYIADAMARKVRKVNLSGIISTFAGVGTPGSTGDGGLATAAQFFSPYGLAIDPSGNVYISDFGGNKIRMVNTSSIISTYAGSGTGGYGGDGGLAVNAQILMPTKIRCYNTSLYLSDGGNQRVRKVLSSGVISTFAGAGVAGYSGDGGLATSAQIDNPQGLAIDLSGNLCMCDAANNRLRLIGCAQPSMSTTSTSSVLCTGNQATLTVSGASTYTWMPGNMTGSVVVVSPTVSTNYTVNGTYYSCVGTTSLNQIVSTCTGVKEYGDHKIVEVWPNPFQEKLTVNTDYNTTEVQLIDLNGRIVFKEAIKDVERLEINTESISSGVYILRVVGPQVRTAKVIK